MNLYVNWNCIVKYHQWSSSFQQPKAFSSNISNQRVFREESKLTQDLPVNMNLWGCNKWGGVEQMGRWILTRLKMVINYTITIWTSTRAKCSLLKKDENIAILIFSKFTSSMPEIVTGIVLIDQGEHNQATQEEQSTNKTCKVPRIADIKTQS